MTFALVSSAWAWALLAGAVAAAILSFIVRPRPPRHRVPSMLIWQRVLDETRDRSVWDRLRWIVSMLLTAAIAAALALALARPAPASGPESGGRLLLVLDSSWTMQARRPTGQTRWDRAVEAAWTTARSAGADEVAIATTADGIVEGPTAELGLIRSALNRLAPTGAPDGAWPRLTGATVHFFTDGTVPRAPDPEVTLHSVFVPVPNVAVTAFDIEPRPGERDTADAFVAVANHAPLTQNVEISLTRGGAVVFARTVQLGAGERHREIVPVPNAGDPRFHARVRAEANALDVDDDVAAWLWAARPVSVGVVSESKALATLLAADRTLQVRVVDATEYAHTPVDLWVFDRWLPDAPPADPALVIDPPASAWFGQRGAVEARPVWRAMRAHPVLEGVDPTWLRVRSVRPVIRDTLDPVVVSGQDTPLVATEAGADGRFVVVAFSTDDSNLSTTPAFPVLVGNAIDWLVRPEPNVRRRPGAIVLPAATSRIIAPNGETLPITRLPDRVTAYLPGPGLFLVTTGRRDRTVVVALGDAERTDLLSSSVPPDSESQPVDVRVTRPWWVLLAIAALGCCLVEWMTWQRRVTV
jgi:hypothetical protein